MRNPLGRIARLIRIGGVVAAGGSVPVALSGRAGRCLRSANCIRSCRPGTASGPGSRGGRREAYISTEYTSTCEEARVPLSHEHPRRSCRPQEPPRQGPRPPFSLIGRLRDRRAFARLGRDGRRIRRSVLWCTWCPDPDSTATSVAYAITRAYGPAVHRNRLRRRLRAILRDLDRTDELPPVMLLIGPRPRSIELTFDQIQQDLTSLVQEIRSQHRALEYSV